MTSRSTVSTVDPISVGPGSVLDHRYQIEAIIGEGGSGSVFRAWDRVLGEPIAIKILHPARAREKSWIKRLAREVKVARAIRHPNVCRVFDLGQADGHWFVTMELATGGSIRELLREAKARPLGDRLTDARALCAGLAAIHAVGITHRDVTPQNVLRMADGRLVLSDFGLAVENTDTTTVHGGTPNYMPPETVMGEHSDQRSDVWQLGAILHEVVFGRRPEWDRQPEGVVMRWPLPADASPLEEEVARLCRDCLAQNPAVRPGTAMAVAGRLAAAEVARPRGALERLWIRGTTAVRQHRRAVAVVLVLVAAAGLARAFHAASQRPLCRAAGEKLEGVWDPRTQDTVRRAFMDTGRSYAGDVFSNVDRVMGRYLAGWMSMYKEACEATNLRGEQSPEVLDLRMACLQDRLAEVRAISQVFQHADASVVANAVDATNAFRPVDRCADVVTLRALVRPPEAGAAWQAVERTRRKLAEVKALRDTGRYAAALQGLATLDAEVRELRYDPLTAETLALRAWLAEKTGDYARAERHYGDALAAAEAARDDETAAESAVEMVGMLVLEGLHAEARRWSGLAGALLRRLGGHQVLQAWLVNNIGLLECGEGRYEAGLQSFRQAADLKQRALGRDHPDVAFSLGNAAFALSKLGRATEALATNDNVLAILERAYGVENPAVALHLSNRGEILTVLGRFDDAREAFKRALAIQDRELEKMHPDKGHALLGLGKTYLDQGRAAAALPFLERAVQVREHGEGDAANVAAARFALAQALWLGGGDRARAVSLAMVARQTYADGGIQGDEAAVSSWLAGRHLQPLASGQ